MTAALRTVERVEALGLRTDSPAVRLRGLRRVYPARPPVAALDGVDLDIPHGEITSILGPSGSGKTTLLRAIAGTERLDAGTIEIHGRTVEAGGLHVPPERRRVGLVPQDGALFPHLDVGRNVAFGLHRLPRSERRQRVEEMLELVGLGGYERRRPHELSGGQQQRVALARALAPAPEIVLLDEPFGALDAALRVSVRTEVIDLLRAQGATAVLVTHDQDEALSVGDVVAVMRDGRIVGAGPPAELYRRPPSLWVARFLGDAVVLDGEFHDGVPPTVSCALGTLPVALPAADSPSAGPVRVCCRPEQIRLATQPSALSGIVRRLRFSGPELVAELDIGGAEATARWSSTEVTVAEGDRVSLEVVGPVVAFAAGPPPQPSPPDTPT